MSAASTITKECRRDLASIGFIRKNVEGLVQRNQDNAGFVRAANLADRALRDMAVRLYAPASSTPPSEEAPR